MTSAKNRAIEINRGTTLSNTAQWPANVESGDLTGWEFSIFDADNVAGMSGLGIAIDDSENRLLGLYMTSENTALLPALSRFRIKGIKDGISYTTRKIEIRIT